MKKVIDLLNEDQHLSIIDVDINDEIQLGTEGPVISPKELLVRSHETYFALEIWRLEKTNQFEYVVNEQGNDIGIDVVTSQYNIISIYIENMASYLGSGFELKIRVSGIDSHSISEINDILDKRISTFVIPRAEKGLEKKKEELEKLEKLKQEIHEYERIIRDCKRAEFMGVSIRDACDPKIKEILIFK